MCVACVDAGCAAAIRPAEDGIELFLGRAIFAGYRRCDLANPVGRFFYACLSNCLRKFVAESLLCEGPTSGTADPGQIGIDEGPIGGNLPRHKKTDISVFTGLGEIKCG